MEILTPIITRRSIRKYKDIPVEDDKIDAMLECARRAPSGDNSQPWNFIIVKSKQIKERITEACHSQEWMLQAPVFIVCVADMGVRFKEINQDTQDFVYSDISEDSPQEEVKLIIRDTTIAIDHLVLQAEAMGLGTCWVAWFNQKNIRPILNIDSDKYVIAVICVGYADEKPEPRPRKSLKDMVHYEVWGRPKGAC
jgi:nitroreductase